MNELINEILSQTCTDCCISNTLLGNNKDHPKTHISSNLRYHHSPSPPPPPTHIHHTHTPSTDALLRGCTSLCTPLLTSPKIPSLFMSRERAVLSKIRIGFLRVLCTRWPMAEARAGGEWVRVRTGDEL